MKHTKRMKIFSGTADEVAERLQAYIHENRLLIGHCSELVSEDCLGSNPPIVRLFLTHNERGSRDPKTRLARVRHFVTTKKPELMEREFEMAVDRHYESIESLRLQTMGQSRRPDDIACLYWFAIYQ